MNTPTLDKVSKQWILWAAYKEYGGDYVGMKLWIFIRDICGVGSTSAKEICKELGWNPDETNWKNMSPGDDAGFILKV